MIDYQTYRKFHQQAEAFTFSKATKHPFDRRRDWYSESSLLKDEDYLLMPPQIHGFVLKEKKWGWQKSKLELDYTALIVPSKLLG
jgi:hypothetical protein